MEKLESGLYGWNADLNEEAGEIFEQTQRFVLKGLPLECREKLARSLSMMCWDMNFPEGMAVLSDGYSSESAGGFNEFDQVQADRRPMRDAKSFGLRMAQVTPSTCCTKVCRRRLCRRHTQMMICFCCCKQQNYGREWQREIVVVQLDVKKGISITWIIELPSRQ